MPVDLCWYVFLKACLRSELSRNGIVNVYQHCPAHLYFLQFTELHSSNKEISAVVVVKLLIQSEKICVFMCVCPHPCSKCRDRGRSRFPPLPPGGWSRRAACGITRSGRTAVMENDASREDGSNGGQRQTSHPFRAWTDTEKAELNDVMQLEEHNNNPQAVTTTYYIHATLLWQVSTVHHDSCSEYYIWWTYFSFFQSFSIRKMSSLSRLTWDKRR